AEHTVMRIGGIEVRWSDDPPHSFGIWSVVAQPLGEPAAVEHGGGGSHIERVVPVGIPPHGDVDGTLVNQLAPELKDLLGDGVGEVDVPVPVMVVEHLAAGLPDET